MADVRNGDAVAEAIKHNYNATGVEVMQAMYTGDYLSMGGPASTDSLARAAGITQDMSVLDIGCGVGGPALRLVQTCGCHVTGIDLVATSIELARNKAQARDLDGLASFQVGDATALPFDEANFDVVFGQDAWCHVPDKHALVGEAARVLRPDGCIAFTDWLRLGNPDTDAQTQMALEAALSESAATRDEYLSLLSEHGFVQVEVEDLSEHFTEQYVSICARLKQQRDALVARFSVRVFDIVAQMNGKILAGFEAGKIGGARFIARRSV